MQTDTMTGLELMRAFADGSLPASAISRTIPMHDFEVEFGRVTFRARGDDRHTNPLGMIHGGVACTVLDSATGIAVHSTLEPGGWLATIDLNVKFFRQLPKDEDVRVEAWVVNASRSLVYSEGRIEDGDGKLLSTAAAIFISSRGRDRGQPAGEARTTNASFSPLQGAAARARL